MSSLLPDEASIAAASSTMPTAVQAETGAAVLSNPLDFPAGYRGTIEDWITLMLPTQASLEALVAKIAQPVGSYLIVPDDLTAQTGAYEYTHPSTGLTYLYANGAAVSQATYAALYALWGASKWAADSGSNFYLPDTRGRDLLLAGTHADMDVGDVFGPATESSRRGNTHGHAVTAATVTGAPALTGAPTAGTLDVSADPHTHSYTAPDAEVAVQSGAGATAVPSRSGGSTSGGTTLSVTGAPGVGTLAVGVGTLDVGGTIGTDTNEGGAGIVIGSLVIRF